VDVPYRDPITGIYYQALATNIKVRTPEDNTFTITLPDATQTSIGTNFIITNVGAADFVLNTSDGMPLQDPVSTGVSYYALLTDNSTPAGDWTVYTFAAGTSEASAIALAGNGLVALAGKLNTNVPVVLTATIPTLDITSRAKLYVWLGNAPAILPLPTIGSVPAGYYVSFSNQGTAQLTIEPGEPGTKISLEPSQAVQVQQSLTIISDGTNWQTLGFGQNQADVVTALSKNVSLSVNVTLTINEAANLIQEYNGLLTANITVFFPVITGQWFIANNTNGAFTLSVQLAGPLGTAYVIPQGSSQIFYSDGTGLFSAPTSLSLANGTLTSPALSFNASSNTGFYYSSPAIGVSAGGVLVSGFQTSGTTGRISVYSANGTSFRFISDNTAGSIAYNNVVGISIDTTGHVTLPAAPLPIGSGGTNANNQQAAINNIMPTAAVGGIPYF